MDMGVIQSRFSALDQSARPINSYFNQNTY
jgi:hypothetical protein